MFIDGLSVNPCDFNLQEPENHPLFPSLSHFTVSINNGVTSIFTRDVSVTDVPLHYVDIDFRFGHATLGE